MTLWNWFSGLFNKNGTLSLETQIADIKGEIFYKQLAVCACKNLIANAITRSEFLTFDKGKEKRGENYYRFNVEPNQNKSANKFWRDVVSKLVHNNECLVIQRKDMYYVADSFDVDKYVFKENIYKNVVIDEYQLSNVYTESQVLHFELHNQKIKDVIDGLYATYSKLIAVSQANYKKNSSRRGTLDIPTNYSQVKDAQEKLNDLLKNKFDKFFNAEGGAVLPLTGGLKYNELSSNIGVKGSSNDREIRNYIDDVFDFVAIAFGIPPQLLKGNVADTDKAVNNFLTFCINPLAELIEDEINRKLYGKKHYLERTYLKIDTSKIRAVDIKDIANALDVLVRIGAYTVDDCLKTLGLEPLNTDSGKARFMTKNYEPIERTLKGGDN